MKCFSQRKGFKKVSEIIQVESMSDELRNSIWNVLDLAIWSRGNFVYKNTGGIGEIEDFSKALWFSYFKKPFDTRPEIGTYILDVIRKYFFECAWFEVYDFL